MNGRVAVVVVLVLLAGVAGVASPPVATAATEQSQSDSLVAQHGDVDPDEVRMDVTLRPDGTAEWTVEFWVRLEDEESREAFRSLEDDIAADPDAHTSEFADRIDDTVAAASDATDREMRADAFAVETARQSLVREYGVVRYTFEWDGFAAVEDGDLHAGDAIEGLYLDDGTRLLIAWPDDHELASVSPEPDDQREQAVIWRGSETDFVSGEPRVVVAPPGTGPGATTAVVALAVGALVVVAIWWFRTRAGDAVPGDDADDDGADAAGEPPTADRPDPDLLSNEEQVLRLVEDRGGRMKQQEVVEELGWTDAKTSKVVSGLREEGKLESFRLGRENVLSLPEETPEQEQ